MTETSAESPDKKSRTGYLTSFFRNNIFIYTIFLFLIFCISFYLRAILPYDSVFRNDIIGFAADDAVYHMRLVENMIDNFPNKIWFDPFTRYSSGQLLHFGPLWTYMIATTSLILGGGSPSLELTRTVGAYFPAIFGSLLIFPVYFIGKEVFDRRVGLLCAFIVAVMPGQILSRSVLGFTDHHVGEVFFSTLYIMFFIIAVRSIRGKDISFADIQNKNWNKIKGPIIISIFSGIAFGLYMLQWSNGVFFGGIIAIFIILQYIIDHMRGRSVEGLCLISIVSYLFAFPLVIFFVDPANSFQAGRYSYLHILITLGSAIFFLLLGLLSVKMNEKDVKKIYYPLTIAGIYALGLVMAKLFVPGVLSSFQTFFTIFQSREGGYLTIAEASPPTHSQIFGAAAYPNNFGNYPGLLEIISTYYLALLAMVIIGALLIFRKWEPEKAILLMWCIIMFALSTGQNRWFYYYSVNVAILSGFIGIALIDITGLKNLTARFRTRVSTPQDLSDFISSNLPQHLLTIFIITIVIIMVFLPNFSISSQTTAGGAISSDYYQWHESLNWMRFNTPDPGLDFDAVYDRPPTGETFNYPDTAYGVMSWWDYGHVITYFAHRIPNANPFQAGIGGGENNLPGASTFFTAESEEEASEVLWNLSYNGDNPGSRYIASNAYMAYAINDVMAVWTYDTTDYRVEAVVSGQSQMIYGQRWYDNMESKLHIFDANGLKQYRMIHESVPNPYARGGNMEQSCKYIYNVMYEGNIDMNNTGFVKLFEVVRGAVISGEAPDGQRVTISNDIKTNQGRVFTYTQTTTAANGSYSLIVPYSTQGPIQGETNFDTMPTGLYTITAGGISQTVDVREEDVLEGRSVTVDLV
ncbi:MAG: oligosaccharyl transferase, archaeosortase A system-associated [Methanosarcinales archaeon]|nr:oligosaccharyl transferase, archaeosortase A system-associated [Methanosarcinales archaeon]